jgi:prolyl-tRNA editing enzyme YbaK/EbsC (Cys-tRNA(Pro) deacylase)
MDEDLLALEEVWAAAGSARAVFPISPDRLRELSGAELIRVH